MEKITTVGIDLAKQVFALHGVDGAGRVVLRKYGNRVRGFRQGQGVPSPANRPVIVTQSFLCSSTLQFRGSPYVLLRGGPARWREMVRRFRPVRTS